MKIKKKYTSLNIEDFIRKKFHPRSIGFQYYTILWFSDVASHVPDCTQG